MTRQPAKRMTGRMMGGTMILHGWPVLLVCVLGCARATTPPKDAAGIAEESANRATTTDQKQLWKEAKDRAAAAGLNEVAPPASSVSERQPPAPSSATSSPSPDPGIAANISGGAEVVDEPAYADFETYSGSGRVLSVKGQRIDLALSGGKKLAFMARSAGLPLRTAAGDIINVDFRSPEDPEDSQEILAVRVSNGDGIVSAIDGGDAPVTLNVPLYNLTAKQVGESQDSMMNVEVRVGDKTRIFKPGEVSEFAGLTIGVRVSNAYRETYRSDGNPYTLDVVAWPVTKK